MMSSRFVHVTALSEFHPFLRLNNIPLQIHSNVSSPFTHELFLPFSYCEQCCYGHGRTIAYLPYLSTCNPRSEIAGSYANPILNFFSNCHSVGSGYTILYSHKQCTRVSVSPQSHRHLLLSVFLFLTVVILMGVR